MIERRLHTVVSRARWWRLLAITAAVATAAFSGTPAAAHTTLLSTTPADQASVQQTPASVVLTFDQPVIAMGTQIVITGPNGPVQAGPPQLVDNTVTQPVQPGSPAGTYTVDWRITSTDGHPVTGQFRFIATAAGSGSPAPTTATPDGTQSQPPSNVAGAGRWIAVLLVVVAAGATALVIRRRTSRPNPPPDTAPEPKDSS